MEDKALLNYLNKSKDDVYAESGQNSEYKTAIYQAVLEERKDGYFPRADYIMKFSGSGELVMFVERAWRKNYNLFSWTALFIKTLLFHPECPEIMKDCFSRKIEYIDFISYKKWWFNWLTKLLKP